MNNFDEQDKAADDAINIMVTAAVGGAIIPAHVNWVVACSAMGIGVVSIGRTYGVQLNKDEAWKLIVQFIRSAGLTWAGLVLGSKIISIILASTGLGYIGAVALDAAVSGAVAYAVGSCAKAYFKGERNKEKLGSLFRTSFESAKEKIKKEKKELS